NRPHAAPRSSRGKPERDSNRAGPLRRRADDPAACGAAMLPCRTRRYSARSAKLKEQFSKSGRQDTVRTFCCPGLRLGNYATTKAPMTGSDGSVDVGLGSVFVLFLIGVV